MKPSIPKGTRDFSPSEMMKRNYIFDVIRHVYQQYGYQQIETPALEYTETLLGKYGEEGDRLIFKILPRGEKLAKMGAAIRELNSSGEELISTISARTEEALRYDLTVPFARYVVQHQNEITFPFKRFQIQTVWRADRPQKGRYREFYQCDADVIGSTSLFNEAELISMIHDVFAKLNIGISIRLNNRKLLSGIAEIIGAQDQLMDITVAIDKLDKIGQEKVNEELASKGLSEKAINRIQPILQLSGSTMEKLAALKEIFATSGTGMEGIAELEEVFDCFSRHEETSRKLVLDLTLARGLNYYTGAIIEVKVDDARSSFSSSICGGGRYDDLTGIFGLPGVSGVGISFGADRIYDVLEEMNSFPDLSSSTVKIMLVNFGKTEAIHCLDILRKLHAAGVNAELFPDAAKMKKQLAYADDKRIPYVALVGSEEIKTNTVAVKNMKTGEQQQITVAGLITLLNQEN